MTYTKYLLFSILVVCPSVLSAQGIDPAYSPDRRGDRMGQTADEGNRRAEDEVRFTRTERKYRPLDGRHPDVQLVRICQELRPRHALDRRLPRHVAFSHTQVTWNGMRINNPMLGMTDFSTIPSYFIDQASLLHGTSSVNETGGGLGGLVKLGTAPHRRRRVQRPVRAGHRLVQDLR
ncbi:Plug domain-containing protein [Bacteroides xylanisolvens]|nr:Plug domain-containing protein [Bacteroides xylanisolvens]